MALGSAIARFTITDQEQERFAHLTGDWNPIHMDRKFARRSTFGDAVVHGMNTALTALDRYRGHRLAVDDRVEALPSGLTIQFVKPVFMNEPLELFVISNDDRRVRLVVQAGKTEVVKIAVNFELKHDQPDVPMPTLAMTSRSAPPLRTPADREIGAGNGLQLRLPLSVEATALSAAFPDLIAWIGERRVAGLALLSTVVGMEWPGANSLFTSAKVKMQEVQASSSDALDLQIDVTSLNVAHKLTSTRITCSDFIAETEAFFRPPAIIMPSMASFVDRVGASAFSGWTAVVIGGSRGLGEVAAKLLAAGDANVLLTYRQSEAEAAAVMADIQASGGRCSLVRYDAAERGLRLPENRNPGSPVLIFYSASPHIFRRRTMDYSRAWLDDFISIYVDGLIDVVDAIKAWSSGRIAIVYPSSQALDLPMAELIEYAAAKAAGEAVCHALSADHRLTFALPRLPRLLTDQTNSIVNVVTEEPADVLLPILRQLMSASNSDS